jgi:hypothetical protein
LLFGVKGYWRRLYWKEALRAIENTLSSSVFVHIRDDLAVSETEPFYPEEATRE